MKQQKPASVALQSLVQSLTQALTVMLGVILSTSTVLPVPVWMAPPGTALKKLEVARNATGGHATLGLHARCFGALTGAVKV